MIDRHFVGETTAITRDAEGRVAEILVTDTQTAQPSRRTVFGAFSKVEETLYEKGKVSPQETFGMTRTDTELSQSQSTARGTL